MTFFWCRNTVKKTHQIPNNLEGNIHFWKMKQYLKIRYPYHKIKSSWFLVMVFFRTKQLPELCLIWTKVTQILLASLCGFVFIFRWLIRTDARPMNSSIFFSSTSRRHLLPEPFLMSENSYSQANLYSVHSVCLCWLKLASPFHFFLYHL